MTTDRTTQRATPLNGGSLDGVWQSASERNVVAPPSARKRGPWYRKTLGVMGLIAAATVFAPSCAVSGSEMRSAADDEAVRSLSPATIEALRKDTGVDPFYVLVFTEKGPTIIGQPPNVKITRYDSEQELWASQGTVSVQSVKPTAFVQFQRNPNVQCFPYSAFGSIRWYCVEIPN